MMTDRIGAFLTTIRNGVSAGHDFVDVDATKMSAAISRVLKKEGFIKSFKIKSIQVKKSTRLIMRVYFKAGAINSLVRVSRPGLRLYSGFSEIPRVASGLGVSVLSTSKGVLSSREAFASKLGGEVLCKIW